MDIRQDEKAIISLDLDLYEKLYLLVHSREDLRNRYVIRLGKLLIVFVVIRKIGTYTEGSGFEKSWFKSGWLSENTIHQVFSCSWMKRALSAHENQLVAIYILYLHGLITESKEPLSNYKNIKPLIQALDSSNIRDINVTIATLKTEVQ